MSTVKTNNVQIGQSVTATNNFTWYQPSTPDGTVRLGNGNSGSVTDLVTLTSAGNLGIGTSSPGSKLTIAGSVSGSSAANGYDAYTATRASRSFCWGLDASGNYGIWDTTSGANNRLLIDSSGNLGIGVTPSAWSNSGNVQIGGAGGNLVFNSQYISVGANWYYNAGYKYIGTGPALLFESASGGFDWKIAPSGTAGNAISFTQAMTLDASGHLFVGKTSTGLGSAGIEFSNVGWGQFTVSGDASLFINRLSSDGATVKFYRNTVDVGSISVTSSATAYNTSSDQRLKTNITPAGSAIQSILDFPIDQFDWIESGEHQDFGAVAQKAVNVIPEMVSVPADPDEMWGIDWSKAVPRLIKTIQEMHEEIQTLKAKVNA